MMRYFYFFLLPLLWGLTHDVKVAMVAPPNDKVQITGVSSTLEIGPILVGPLLSPSGETLPSGHIDVEPILFVNTYTGFYDNNWHFNRLPGVNESINFFLFTQYGLNSFMDFTFMPQLNYNSFQEGNAATFGDLFWDFGVQLIHQNRGKGFPGIKFILGQIVPTGKFDELDPKKFFADAGGGGCFNTLFALVASYVWNLGHPRYLVGRLSVGYWLASHAKVRGLNTYGGDRTTNGTVHPGDTFQVLMGLEHSLTRYWGVTIDIDSELIFPTKFKGCTHLPVGIDAMAYQLSIAPAIEYNYSHNLGAIFGVWFSIIGRNENAFVSGVIAINFYL